MKLPSIFHPANTSYQGFSKYHLAEFHSLDRYDNKWAVFGSLTYAKNPPVPSTQIKHFEELMESLSELNHSHPDLLHWFVRVEHSLAERWHLHFLLGHERTTNGHHTPMTVDTVCAFLTTHWFHGESHVVPYDRTEDVVGYVTKTPDRTLIGETRMSPSLFKTLKRAPSSSRREDEIKRIGRYHDEQRDPDIVEIIIKLRRIGINASFGDEGLLRKAG